MSVNWNVSLPVGNIGSNINNFFSRIKGHLGNFGDWVKDRWNDFTGLTAVNKNLEFQRDNLESQKQLQEQIQAREDNTYQRTVADMRAAGLNPLMMSGTNGAGEAVASNAPMVQRTSDIQALGEIMNVISQLNVNRNNNTLSQANANLVNAQANNQKIKNLYEADILSKTIDQLDLSNIGKRFQNTRDNIAWQQEIRNLAFNEQFGLSDNMPDFAKFINYATHQGSLDKDWYKNNSPSDWNDFGKFFSHSKDYKNPSFTNMQSLLEKTNLKGALSESTLGIAFLKMLGIY